jgi:hypothetical protein
MRWSVRQPALLVPLLVVLASGGTARAETALQNPSFEEAMDPSNWECDIAKGWTRWGHWMNRETGWLPTKSGECLIGYHHWEINGTENSGFSQLVHGLKTNAAYTFSIHVSIDKDTNAESIELRLSDDQGDLAEYFSEIKTLPVGEWTQLSVTAKATSDRMWVNVIVEPLKKVKAQWDRKGSIKFDDADFHRTETYE